MLKLRQTLPLLLICTSFVTLLSPLDAAWFSSQKKSQEAKDQSAIEIQEDLTFIPPKGWRLADSSSLSKNVKIMVVGKGKSDYPPSINLATETYKDSVKDYLRIIKNLNDSQGYQWKDLGTIQTDAGPASLSQLDMTTKWGEARMMHVILKKNQTMYILTVAALQDEFPQFYKQFFKSMRSLSFNVDPLLLVKDKERREKLERTIAKLEASFSKLVRQQTPASPQQAFESKDFQTKFWEPFRSMLNMNFGDMEPNWQPILLTKIQMSMLQPKEEKETD